MYFCGDTHGNNDYLKMIIDDKGIRNTTIIHAGDFNVGFNGMDEEIKKLKKLDLWLGERNIILAICRGNHDNPNYFDGTIMFNNLKLYPDYTVLNVEGKNILLVGGAISIDRVPHRRYNIMEIIQNNHSEKRYHWEGEKFVLDREKLEGMRDINVVVTHTAPSFAKPFNVKGKWPYIVAHFMGEDPNLGDDLVAERTLLDEMYTILNKNNYIELWAYGHFHQNLETIHDATTFKMLAINEMYHYTIGDFEDEMNGKYE